MIFGIGVDTVNISRLTGQLGYSSLKRLFTKAEYDECELTEFAPRHLAGRLAAKEAVMKALGVDLRELEINLTGIRVRRIHGERPRVGLAAHIRKLRPGVGKIHVSISYCGDVATAVAIAEEK